MAKSKGYPVIIDYFQRGLKIIGPGTGVARSFVQKNPNTLKIFLMGYLDGVRRAIDDPARPSGSKRTHTQKSTIQNAGRQLQEGKKVWNKDMTVDADAIKLVLEQSTVAKAADIDPSDSSTTR